MMLWFIITMCLLSRGGGGLKGDDVQLSLENLYNIFPPVFFPCLFASFPFRVKRKTCCEYTGLNLNMTFI